MNKTIFCLSLFFLMSFSTNSGFAETSPSNGQDIPSNPDSDRLGAPSFFGQTPAQIKEKEKEEATATQPPTQNKGMQETKATGTNTEKNKTPETMERQPTTNTEPKTGSESKSQGQGDEGYSRGY